MTGEAAMRERGYAALTVWTIGHSTRPLPPFLALLERHGIEAVADVRRFPASRRHPQYAGPALEAALRERDIAYIGIPALGGRRHPAPGPPGNAWRNAAFRGYADYLKTDEFAAGLFDLLMAAWGLRTAVMCAEALWWRCHRRLIADVLVSLGARVVHIMDARTAQPHELAPPARLVRGALTYAPEAR